LSWELAAVAFIADGAFSRFLDRSVITAPSRSLRSGAGAGAVLDATGLGFRGQTIRILAEVQAE
jgi:hypothetical protein